MKAAGNCIIFSRSTCPFHQRAVWHAGYTGQSGPDTWSTCAWHKQPIRHIKECCIAGDADAQHIEWRELKAREAQEYIDGLP